MERVKFCLENINDNEIKKQLIILTNSFERKNKIIENIENLGELETNTKIFLILFCFFCFFLYIIFIL